MANLERLYRLTVDAGQAVRELQQLNTSVGRIDKGFGDLGNSLKTFASGAAMTAGINALVSSFQQTAKAMADVGDRAQSLQLSTTALQSLSYAATQSGASVQNFEQGMNRLAVQIADGGKALEAMGVKTRDATGNIRSTDSVLKDIADRFTGYRDNANKAALAADLFGKEAGPKLLQMLNQGSAGITQLEADAKRLGVVMSADAVAAAKAYGDTMDGLNLQMQALRAELVGPLAAAISGYINQVNAARVYTASLGEAIALTTRMKFQEFMAGNGQEAQNRRMAEYEEKKIEFAKEGAKWSAEARDIRQRNLEQLAQEIRLYGTLRPIQLTPPKPDIPRVDAPNVSNGGGGGKKGADGAAAAAREANQRAKDLADSLKAQQDIMDEAWGFAVKYYEDLGKREAERTKDLEKQGEVFGKQLDDMIDRADALTVSMQQQAQSVREGIDPFYKYETELKRLEELKPYLPIEAFRKALAKLDTDFAKSIGPIKRELTIIDQASSILTDNFNSFFENLQKGTANASEAFKRMGQSIVAQLARLALNKLFVSLLGGTLGVGLNASGSQIVAKNALGGVFDKGLKKFASGGVVAAPTFFGMAGGKTGLMGEAGPEAIMPLRRSGSGALGVEATAPVVNVNVVNNAGAQVSTSQDESGNITVLIENIKKSIANDIRAGGNFLSGTMERTYGVNRAVGAR